MHDENLFPPEVVKTVILQHAKHVVTISVWDDGNANLLAESLGAEVLLDKTKLYDELISAITKCCSVEAAMPYGEGKNFPMNGDRVESQVFGLGTVRGVRKPGDTDGHEEVRVEWDDGTVSLSICNTAEFTVVSRQTITAAKSNAPPPL